MEVAVVVEVAAAAVVVVVVVVVAAAAAAAAAVVVVVVGGGGGGGKGGDGGVSAAAAAAAAAAAGVEEDIDPVCALYLAVEVDCSNTDMTVTVRPFGEAFSGKVYPRGHNTDSCRLASSILHNVSVTGASFFELSRALAFNSCGMTLSTLVGLFVSMHVCVCLLFVRVPVCMHVQCNYKKSLRACFDRHGV